MGGEGLGQATLASMPAAYTANSHTSNLNDRIGVTMGEEGCRRATLSRSASTGRVWRTCGSTACSTMCTPAAATPSRATTAAMLLPTLVCSHWTHCGCTHIRPNLSNPTSNCLCCECPLSDWGISTTTLVKVLLAHLNGTVAQTWKPCKYSHFDFSW